MNKKVLISGYIGFNNFGDDAIFGCLVNYLKSKNVDITALSSNPEYSSKTYGIQALRYKNPIDILKGIMGCDVLISGGGSLLQDKTSKMSLFYYLFIIFMAKIFNKKVIIFSQGIGPIVSGAMQIITKNILKLANFVTVRDENSHNILKNWGINSKLLCDPFWSINLEERKSEGIIGVQLREYKNMRSGFIKDLAVAFGKYFHNRKIQVFCFQNSYDKKICEEFVKFLKAEYNNLDIELVLNTSVEKTISDFSKLEYIVAMRYHACLLAIKYGIKTLPIIYDSKVEVLASDFKLAALNCEKHEDISSIFEKSINENGKNEPKIFDWQVFDKFLD